MDAFITVRYGTKKSEEKYMVKQKNKTIHKWGHTTIQSKALHVAGGGGGVVREGGKAQLRKAKRTLYLRITKATEIV